MSITCEDLMQLGIPNFIALIQLLFIYYLLRDRVLLNAKLASLNTGGAVKLPNTWHAPLLFCSNYFTVYLTAFYFEVSYFRTDLEDDDNDDRYFRVWRYYHII